MTKLNTGPTKSNEEKEANDTSLSSDIPPLEFVHERGSLNYLRPSSSSNDVIDMDDNGEEDNKERGNNEEGDVEMKDMEDEMKEGIGGVTKKNTNHGNRSSKASLTPNEVQKNQWQGAGGVINDENQNMNNGDVVMREKNQGGINDEKQQDEGGEMDGEHAHSSGEEEAEESEDEALLSKLQDLQNDWLEFGPGLLEDSERELVLDHLAAAQGRGMTSGTRGDQRLLINQITVLQSRLLELTALSSSSSFSASKHLLQEIHSLANDVSGIVGWLLPSLDEDQLALATSVADNIVNDATDRVSRLEVEDDDSSIIRHVQLDGGLTMLPNANYREYGDLTQLSDEQMKAIRRGTSVIVLDDEPGLGSWPREGEEDPEYARLSRVLDNLPMERLLARPCLGDDGGLAPELHKLWARNTVKISGPPGTKLPFKMRKKEQERGLNSVCHGQSATNAEAAVETTASSEDEEVSSPVANEVEAAAAAAAAAKPTAASNSEDLKVDIRKFDTLIHSSGDTLVAETKVPILRVVQEIIRLSFKSETGLYGRIKDLASHFVSVLTELPLLGKVFGAYLRQESVKEASEMESEVPLSDGFGSIMSSCEKKTSETEDDDQSNAVPDKVIEIKKSILYAENGYNDDTIKQTIFRRQHGDTTAVSGEAIDKEVTDEDVKSFINDEVTNTSVKKHLLMGRQTNSLLMHLLNLYFAAYFLSALSIRQLFEHFTEEKQAALIAKLREFALRSNPEVPFHEGIKAILYLERFVAPSLRKKELREDAWEVACTVFNYLNKIECTGKRDTAETKANDPRKKYFIHLARTFECQTANGPTDDTAVVFWSGTTSNHSTKRLSAFRTFAVLFLREAIEGSLEPGFFSELDFTRCFLRLPPSRIYEWTKFVTPTFFAEQEKYSTKFDDIINKARSKEGDTGERTLFIRGDEQRKSLNALRKTYVALSSNGDFAVEAAQQQQQQQQRQPQEKALTSLPQMLEELVRKVAADEYGETQIRNILLSRLPELRMRMQGRSLGDYQNVVNDVFGNDLQDDTLFTTRFTFAREMFLGYLPGCALSYVSTAE